MIGGGLLGLEAARGLQNFSLDVHVIQRGHASWASNSIAARRPS